MRIRQKIALGLASLGLLASYGVVGAHVADATPAHQMIDNRGVGSGLCWNRSGGGTSKGTTVIAYNCGDNNNNFEEVGLPNMCNGGVVTQVCPFVVGSGLNAAWVGSELVTVEWGTSGLCVGGNSQSDNDAHLTDCPNDDGSCPVSNSCWSTIMARVPSAYPGSGGRNYDVLVNRNWSNWYVTHSTPQCNAWSCTLIASSTFGIHNPIVLQVGDAQVRANNPGGAAAPNQWSNP